MKTPDVTTEKGVALFMDVHDYSIAPKGLAGGLYSFLQELYEDLGDIIVEHEGEIVKYIGDTCVSTRPPGGRLGQDP